MTDSASDRERHEFVGRLDRWCERCNRPDRDPIHAADREHLRDLVCQTCGAIKIRDAGGYWVCPDTSDQHDEMEYALSELQAEHSLLVKIVKVIGGFDRGRCLLPLFFDDGGMSDLEFKAFKRAIDESGVNLEAS